MAGSGTHIVVGVVPHHAVDILTAAAVFARQFDAELVCATVNPSRYTVVSLPLTPDHSQGRREQPDPALQETITATLAGAGVRWSVQALAGNPARELQLLADRVDAGMIVIGTREPGTREAVREFFDGSVIAELTHSQHRPVVVVPLNVVNVSGKPDGLPEP